MRKAKIYCAAAICVFLLVSCSITKKVAYYTDASLVLGDTEPVLQKKWDKDGNAYYTKESIPMGSFVLPAPVKVAE
jgi:hypothetical protein